MSVQVTFRTLKGDSFKLPADPSDSILDLKKKVGDRQQIVDHVGYRLIYKGKILSDDATIASTGISDQGFVVVMPPKKTPAHPTKSATAAPEKPVPMDTSSPPSTPSAPASAPASTDPAPIPNATAEAVAAKTTTEAATAKSTTATASAGGGGDARAGNSADSLLTGEAFNSSIQQMVEMGFPEEQAKKAMRAAFNNPTRAVDYLFNGIPDTAPADAPDAPAATHEPAATSTAPGPAPEPVATNTQTTDAHQTTSRGTPFNMFEAPPSGGATAGAGGGEGGQGGSSLGFLRSLPQFNTMRRLIQANPNMLPQILQQLEEAYPSLLAIIDANQAEFTALINEPLREGEDGGDEEGLELLAQAMAGGPGQGGAQGGPGQIFVTEEEHEQIVRLSELGATIGLEASHVLQTWLACNRDETLAANFLVDHAEELRADMQQNSPDAPNQSDTPDADQSGPPA